ncbi:predicted protein [Sclerotinia sclerotiorum 1980 UF-70]|uniref:Uncharacterized protein n=1 Tax=Sclerotinia sclerotiorum (strain ATCC 18683 / 1980 / Ss-1) TaxID=665079 RepID=A7F2K6_SCLS1|nr:predicted protein [Sclerotinia sclerotiorum 1980 UF-70]EDN95948.1 predicted protein [Sclerotinia sclerotiorum 1980 UF-70]
MVILCGELTTSERGCLFNWVQTKLARGKKWTEDQGFVWVHDTCGDQRWESSWNYKDLMNNENATSN